MSEDSISYGEDKENLLYISKKINVDEFGLGEEGLFRKSLSSIVSDVSVEHAKSEIELLEQIKGPKTLSNPELSSALKPFTLAWSFGLNSKVGLINLTDDTRKQLFFSCVHCLVFFDYCTREMIHVAGHQSLINCLSSDNTGSYLVSTEEGSDGCLIIWNSKDMAPIYTRFNLYTDTCVLLTAISPCARYLVTIGANDDTYYTVDFWLWTLGKDNSNDAYLINKTHGAPVKICFNQDQQEHVMVVFEKQVFFFVWDTSRNKYSNTYLPEMTGGKKLGNLTGGTYIEQCHECYVTTTRGFILVFRTTLYTKSFDDATQLNNSKMYINAVKVTQASIGLITTTEGKLVIGDSKGHLYFFDKRLTVLYWIKNIPFGPITDISFPVKPPTIRFDGEKVIIKKRNLVDDDVIFDCFYKDIHEEIENITKINPPIDASLRNDPFIVNDFFITTADCNIYAIDFLNNIGIPLFHIADSNITSIDAHDEMPYIVIGYENGRITLINYDTKEQIATVLLPKCEDTTASDVVSYVKYSYKSLHLTCGKETGEVWILEPIILTPKCQPFRCTKFKVEKIAFSHNSLQFAYYDSNKTVLLFNYNVEKVCWEYYGKTRSHYDSINDMNFFYINDKSTLYTIGADRYLVEYNNADLTCHDDPKQPLGAIYRERIEQSSKPLNFTYLLKSFGPKQSVGYILIANDKHKLKLIHEITKVPRSVFLGPSFGCFQDACIRKMAILPFCQYRYMVFMSKKHIGIHILPPDGSPYKYNGYLAHPVEVRDFVLSHDGQYAFTFGMDDRCVLQWQVNPKSIEMLHLLGGTELEPYYCLLEGGKSGWLFQEMQDLFFYMQILQHENIDLPRRVSDCINLNEIPDLVKTCGFYPSEFEHETMMIDITYRDFDETGVVRTEISFVEFVKLFINHRPAYGYSLNDIKDVFKTMCKMADYPLRNKIEAGDFLYLLENIGEPIPHLHKYLTTLLRATTASTTDFNFLPQ
ncbi:cilia- and flagella-associated protein 251-like isoform X2 [Sitophilus oryzae]|nr:cilia- and flagella-associated protein 251-like isoform X2 [Sitophilus oryzae]